MSRATEIARRILDESEDERTGRLRPTEHDLAVASVYASIAQAEALERMAEVLHSASNASDAYPLFVRQV